jgi:FkbM family methyltransferase
MDKLYFIKDLWNCRFDMQKWCNNRFNDPDRTVVDNAYTRYVETKDGFKWVPCQLEPVMRIYQEYQFLDIKEDDVVLDLGAHIGAFALRAAQVCKHVFAVEPLFNEELERNIELNGLQDKVTVCPFGVGDGRPIDIEFFGKKKEMVRTHTLGTFRELIKKKHGMDVTFLKIDVEGAEWLIYPEDLNGIRRIEFEAHPGRNSLYPVNEKLVEYIKKNYTVNQNPDPTGRHEGYYIHAKIINLDS